MGEPKYEDAIEVTDNITIFENDGTISNEELLEGDTYNDIDNN